VRDGGFRPVGKKVTTIEGLPEIWAEEKGCTRRMTRTRYTRCRAGVD